MKDKTKRERNLGKLKIQSIYGLYCSAIDKNKNEKQIIINSKCPWTKSP